MFNWFSNINLKRKILAINAVPIILMLLLAGAMYYRVNSLLETGRWVQHTEKVITFGHELTEELLSMETGQRGFLITGKDNFLQPYRDSKKKFDDLLEESKLIVSDNPDQVKNLNTIGELVIKWTKVAAEPEINLRKMVKQGAANAEDLQMVLREGTGKNILDNIRRILDELNAAFFKSHDHEALTIVTSVGKDMVDQETGERGFLITGKDEFLEPYRKGQEEIKKHLKSLHSILDNAFDRDEMEKEADALVILSEKWLAEAAEPAINAKSESFETIQKMVTGQLGKNILDEIRLTLDRMDTKFKKAHNEEGRSLIVRIGKSMVDMESGERGFLITGENEFLKPFHDGRSALKVHLAELNSLIDNAYDINIARRNTDTVGILSASWLIKAAEPEIKIRMEMNNTTTFLSDVNTLIEKETGKNIMDELRDRLTKFINVEKELIKKRQKLAESSAKNTSWFIGAGTLLAILLVFFIGGQAALAISLPISQFIKAANEVAAGDLSKSLDIVSKDEIGTLALTFEKMTVSLRKASEQQKEENWLKSNTADILNSIRGVRNYHAVAEMILNKLSSIIEICYSAFYICEVKNHKSVLTLFGVYGAQKKMDIPVSLTIEESLAGQCAWDKKPILRANISSDQMLINVGLVRAAPLTVFLQPILFEEECLAVLELASFGEFTETEKTLVAQLAIQIGIILDSVKAFIKTEDLLTDVQVEQEKLEKVNLDLERTSQFKSEFLANMSHEIRTPMNAILGRAELLAESNLDKEQRSHTNVICQAGDTLLLLINDILDLSKIEAGKIVLENIPFHLSNLLAGVVSIMGVGAGEKGLDLRLSIETEIPDGLMGDSSRIRQILINLVGNAIKFTSKGSIIIGLKKNQAGWRFAVTDTGIGIPMEKQKTIFHVFSQADTSTTRKFGGSGLGLAISTQFVLLMGGKLQVESEEGKGSTFFFTIPLKTVEVRDMPEVKPIESRSLPVSWEKTRSLNILLVEDNNDNRNLILLFLKKTSHTVDIAENGQIAVDKLCSGNYDIALMDVEMPVMDGLTATREIRKWEQEGEKERTTIVALTAHALTEFKEKSYKAGCDGHLVKPIKKTTLLDFLTLFAETGEVNVTS